MTGNPAAGPRILGALRADDGAAVLRIEDRLDTGIDDAWTALTDPARLARWYGEIEGDLRPGGEYRARLFASGWEGTGRVAACEPPHRLVLTSNEDDDPDTHYTEVTLTPDGDGTLLVVEQHGLPPAHAVGYGAGMQIHVEDLAAHLAGGGRCEARARFEELEPGYAKLAADLD